MYKMTSFILDHVSGAAICGGIPAITIYASDSLLKYMETDAVTNFAKLSGATGAIVGGIIGKNSPVAISVATTINAAFFGFILLIGNAANTTKKKQ